MYKVMLVDDMEIVRLEMKRLEVWGENSGFYIAFEASNGREALEILKDNHVDLMITDIRMPYVDGMELLSTVTKKGLCSCAVLLSDFCEFNYARQAMVYGAFDFVAKPPNKEEISYMLQRAGRFLEEKKQAEIKRKQLEKIAVDQAKSFYPVAQVKQIKAKISNGDTDAVVLSTEMTMLVHKVMDRDINMTSMVLQNTKEDILNSLTEKLGWFDKLVDTASLHKQELTKCSTIQELEQAYSDIITRLVAGINDFNLCKIHGTVINDVCSFVLNHLDQEWTIKEISEKLFINKTYLSAKFKDKTGIALKEYLTKVKMARAKILIREGKLKNYEIAEKLGFKDIEYFSKLFKKSTGASPTHYRHTFPQ